MSQGEEQKVEQGSGVHYVRGLSAAVRDNASAYGYSVAITATFGLVSAIGGSPKAGGRGPRVCRRRDGSLRLRGGGDLARGFRRSPEDEPARAKELGSSISIFSICSALLVAFATGLLLRGFAHWPLGAFLDDRRLPLRPRAGTRRGRMITPHTVM